MKFGVCLLTMGVDENKVDMFSLTGMELIITLGIKNQKDTMLVLWRNCIALYDRVNRDNDNYSGG
jgi:hypothetical protein